MHKHIGIFSGTFDPIHNGHIALAKAAKKMSGLDRVYMLVEKTPRRKTNVTSYEHRLKMCQLACQNYEWLEVMELGEERFTNSVTLPKLKKLSPNSELNLIIGSDLFKNLPSWPDADQLVAEASFIVSLRGEHDENQINQVANETGAKCNLVDNKFPHVSSSKVRASLSRNEPAQVDARVREYAKENRLY